MNDLDLHDDADVGSRLRRLRENAGLSPRAAARAVGLRPRRLRSYERGRAPVPLEARRALAAHYGVDAATLVPSREAGAVMVQGATLRVGGATRRVSVGDPTPDDVLGGYVHLLYQLRGLRPGDPLPLRDEDLDRLAMALGSDPDEIERQLIDVMHCSAEEARRLRAIIVRRRIIAPAAGLAAGVFGLNAAGLPVLPTGDGSAVETAAVDGGDTEVAGLHMAVPAGAPAASDPGSGDTAGSGGGEVEAPETAGASSGGPGTGGAPAATPPAKPPVAIGDPLVLHRDPVVPPSDPGGSTPPVAIGDPLVIDRDSPPPAPPADGSPSDGPGVPDPSDPADPPVSENPPPGNGGEGGGGGEGDGSGSGEGSGSGSGDGSGAGSGDGSGSGSGEGDGSGGGGDGDGGLIDVDPVVPDEDLTPGPPDGVGGPPDGVGDPLDGVGGPPDGVGDPLDGVGGPPDGVGDPPDGVGDPLDGVGGPPDGVGDPPDGVGGPPDGVGDPPDEVEIDVPDDGDVDVPGGRKGGRRDGLPVPPPWAGGPHGGPPGLSGP